MKFQKTVCDISFSEKVRIFSHDYLKCCIYIANFSSSRYLFTKMLFSKLIGASQVLEDFLDFHGAKNNTNLYTTNTSYCFPSIETRQPLNVLGS